MKNRHMISKKELAEYYDLNYHFWIKNRRESIRRQYLDLIVSQPPGSVIDFGCGTGIDAGILSQKGFKGIGIDLSEMEIAYCKQRGINNWTFHTGDTDTFWLNQFFDYALSSMEIMYHYDLAVTFANYRKHLKKNGYFVLVTNNPYLISWEYKLDYLEEVLYQHSFGYKKKTMPKFFRPLRSFLDAASATGFSLVEFREIVCQNDDCRNFDKKNKFHMPDFLALNFIAKGGF